MKQASTPEITDQILYDVIKGRTSKPICKIEYEDDGGAWVEFDDIESVTITKDSDDTRYGSFSLLPSVSTVSISFDNAGQKYSPDSGNEFDGILIRNRQIRVYFGYDVGTLEYFLQGYFLFDDPSFSSSYGSYKASISGRDFLKRALETKVSLGTITAKDIVLVIREVCDKAQIPYTTGTLPTLGALVTVTASDNFKESSAKDILNQCMAYIVSQVDSNYTLAMADDGNFSLILRPDSATTSDFVMDYRYDLLSVSKGYTQNNLLQRVTVFQKDHGSGVEISLDTDTFITAGTKTLSWANESVYKRMVFEYNASSDDVFVEIVDVSLTQIQISITGTTIDVDVEVFGVELNATPPPVGEWISTENHVIRASKQFTAGLQVRNGFTQKIVNVFLADDTQAKTMASSYIDKFGNRLFEVSTSNPCNPLLENNDKVMIFEKYTNTNTIFVLSSLSHSFNADGAKFTSSFKFIDFGFTLDFATFTWDKNGYNEGATDIPYDSGYLWDQDLGYVIEDATDYNYLLPVEIT